MTWRSAFWYLQMTTDEFVCSSSALRVGLAYNLRREAGSGPADAQAEYDDPDTVEAIKAALEKTGCRVELFEAEECFPAAIAAARPDIVFNIAEGRRGRGREAHVPAILSFLGIPFTGSGEAAMCVTLDKALVKRLLGTYRIRTPGYRVAGDTARVSVRGLSWPLIVKPNAEGSGMGITDVSVVSDAAGLSRAIEEGQAAYGQEMLVEEYIHGREFTVGLLGNGAGARAFPPMEILFKDKEKSIYGYEVKRDFRQYVDYACPPDIGGELRAEMENTALKIYRILGCRDLARIDFRLSGSGQLYFIEINPLPGLAPDYSDYPILAGLSGMDYTTLIQSILHTALERYGLTGMRR